MTKKHGDDEQERNIAAHAERVKHAQQEQSQAQAKAADPPVEGTPASINEPVPTPHQQETPAEAAVLTSLEPNTAVCGDALDIDMHVIGTGFTAASVIYFAGNAEPTTFNSETDVSTGVKPSLFVAPDACPVVVRNGAVDSNELDFTFTDPAARSAGTRSRAEKDEKSWRR